MEWYLCSWVQRLNILRMTILPNLILIYVFNAIPWNLAVNYFVDINKLILKLTGEAEDSRRANLILKGKNKIEGMANAKLQDLTVML